MRRRQKKNVDSFGLQRLPGEFLEREAAVPGDVRIKLVELGRSAGFTVAREQHRLLHLRVAIKQARQLEAGIAGSPDYSRLNVRGHQARSPSNRVCNCRAFLLFPEMMRMVSSPATVPTTSSQPSASMATATGCALPGIVLMTSRFCARRTSRTNSRTTRETAGMGSTGASPLGRM